MIREEIEKLRLPDGHFLQNFVAIDAVLAILDKWEYMGGHTFRSKELAELDIFDGPCPPGRARTIEFNPGDRIVVYRMGEEDNDA